jgi:hypothetical protein
MQTNTEPKPRPLSPWEICKADELLGRDGFPEAYVTNQIRLQVLIRAGWRRE